MQIKINKQQEEVLKSEIPVLVDFGLKKQKDVKDTRSFTT